MKLLKTLLVITISMVVFSCAENNTNTNTASINKKNSIEVYDFHSTNRCITCQSIENNTQFTLETFFAEELKNKTISFQIVNVDKDENYALAEKFQATGTALFLNVIKDNKEQHIDLTDFAFKYGKKQEEFSKLLKDKIAKQLETL
jgi:hypothetical protein